MELLAVALDQPTRRGRWRLELDLAAFAERVGILPGTSGRED